MMFDMESKLAERMRRIFASQSRAEAEIGRLSVGNSSVDQHLWQILNRLGGLNKRMDRFDERLSRVERRLDLVEA